MTFDEFPAWESEQDTRFEYLDGRPVALEGSTQARASLIADLVSEISPRLKGTGKFLLTGMRVSLRVIGQVRYPAIIVDAGPLDSDAMEAKAPILVIDVGQCRDWSSLPGTTYLLVDVDDGIGEIMSALRPILD